MRGGGKGYSVVAEALDSTSPEKRRQANAKVRDVGRSDRSFVGHRLRTINQCWRTAKKPEAAQASSSAGLDETKTLRRGQKKTSSSNNHPHHRSIDRSRRGHADPPLPILPPLFSHTLLFAYLLPTRPLRSPPPPSPHFRFDTLPYHSTRPNAKPKNTPSPTSILTLSPTSILTLSSTLEPPGLYTGYDRDPRVGSGRVGFYRVGRFFRLSRIGSSHPFTRPDLTREV